MVLSALGVGFPGGAVLVRWLDRIELRVTLAGAPLMTAAGFVVLFSAERLGGAMAAAVVIRTFGSVTLIAPQTALQRTALNELLGRIAAVFLAVEALATLVGAVAGPWLALSDALAIRNTPFNGSNIRANLNSPNAFSPSLNRGRVPRDNRTTPSVAAFQELALLNAAPIPTTAGTCAWAAGRNATAPTLSATTAT